MRPQRCIVLLGIGHTNAEIVRRWRHSPIPDCRLICVSKFAHSTYSGMLPGTLSYQLEPDEMEIPLSPLAECAGAELILDEVVGLVPGERRLEFANHESVTFDALSIGIGSVPAGWNDFNSPLLVPIKPMQTFIERLDQRLDQSESPPKCVVVGGGVAGIEVALCLHTRLARRSPGKRPDITVVTGSHDIAEGMTGKSRLQLERLLRQRAVEIVTEFRVSQVTRTGVLNDQGDSRDASIVVWTTGAAAPELLRTFDLPTDESGFLSTTPALRTVAGHPIFAVGDSGTIRSDPAPKAGVFAVRQAPVLWNNLKSIMEGLETEEFHPQKNFLKILNTGDGRALLEYRGFTFYARWCWWLKCWIDRSFVRKYRPRTEMRT